MFADIQAEETELVLRVARCSIDEFYILVGLLVPAGNDVADGVNILVLGFLTPGGWVENDAETALERASRFASFGEAVAKAERMMLDVLAGKAPNPINEVTGK
jgi:hypothetical protein